MEKKDGVDGSLIGPAARGPVAAILMWLLVVAKTVPFAESNNLLPSPIPQADHASLYATMPHFTQLSNKLFSSRSPRHPASLKPLEAPYQSLQSPFGYPFYCVYRPLLTTMFPPRQGNDHPEVGSQFVISLYGTKNVFTAEGKDLRIKAYTGNSNQVWTCGKASNNYFGFANKQSTRWMGWIDGSKMGCQGGELRLCEWLSLTRSSEGGYKLSVFHKDKLCPTVFVSEGDGYLRVAEVSCSVLGLHRLDEPVFRNFHWVLPGKLARASAPHYHSQDEDQCMDHVAVDFLVSHAIKNVVSLNSHPLSSDETTALGDRGITYTHLAVVEYGAPTLAQLQSANSRYASGGTTLVYSGYGQGRAGTVVSALQLYSGRRLVRCDYKENNVQTKEQHDVLDMLKLNLRGGSCDPGQRAASATVPSRGAI